MNNEMYPLFSQPVMVSRPEIPPFLNIIEYCKTLEYSRNAGGNYSSLNTNILDEPELSDIRKLIENAVDYYTKEIMQWRNNEFYITQSWINVNPKDTRHHIHYHYNSIISGTFYVQAADNDEIMFYHDAKPMLDFDKSSYNIWNSSSYSIPVRTNSIAVFPSTMMHSVKDNKEDFERISIAYNVFVKGQLGSKERLTFLEL